MGLGDASLFPALMAGMGVPEEHRPGLLEALARRDFVELGAQARGRRAVGGGGGAAAEPAPAPRRPGGAGGRGRAGGGGRHGDAPGARAARAGGRGAGDLRPRPGAEHRLLHGRGVRGVRPGARCPDRRRRPVRRAARPLRARAARGWLRAGGRPPAYRPGGRGARDGRPAGAACVGASTGEPR